MSWLSAHTDAIGVWLAALLTLAIFSFLLKDNPLYKFAEHLFVGVSQGYGVAVVFHNAVVPNMIDPLFRPERVGLERPDYAVILPVLIGLMWFARFVPGITWVTRIPIAIFVGYGSGLAITQFTQGQILPQLKGTMQPLIDWVAAPGAARTASVTWENLWSLLLAVGVICTLAYFYFSRPHTGALGRVSRVGIWFLMIAFGAGFGYTVMARVSLLIGRMHFLIFDWFRDTVLRGLGVG